MLGFPLGILSAAGAGGVPATEAYELISTTTLGTATASVSFSSLGDYASTYKHLQIRMLTRSSTASTGQDALFLRFNGVTSASYSWHSLFGNGSTVNAGDKGTSTTGIAATYTPRNNNTANAFAATVIDILDAYSSTKNTTVRCLTGHEAGASAKQTGLFSGAFLNTDSVSSITLLPEANNFVANCRFSLYGIKG